MAPTPTPRLGWADRDGEGGGAPAGLVDVRDRILRAAQRICPAWLAGQRDDVAQAAVLRVLPQLERAGVELGDPYLRRVVYCAMVDEIRKLRARREVSLDDPYSYARGEDASPEDSARARELGHEIRECLTRLAASRRRAVTLYLAGHGVSEIATLLGWDTKRAENLVGRGRADLRACLKTKGLEP